MIITVQRRQYHRQRLHQIEAGYVEMIVLYLEALLFILAAIVFFNIAFLIAARGKNQVDSSEFTAAIKTVDAYTHCGYQVNDRY
jgi:hypothetical protein